MASDGKEGRGEYCKKPTTLHNTCLRDSVHNQLVPSSLTTWDKQREVSGFQRRRHGEHAGPLV
jgi:hypothetical protein